MNNQYVCIGCAVVVIVIYLLMTKDRNPSSLYSERNENYQAKRGSYSENYEAIHTTPYSTYQRLVMKHPSTLTTEELESVIALDGQCRSPGLVDNNRAAVYHATW